MSLSFQTNGLKGHMYKKLNKPHLWLAGHYSLYPKQPTIKMIVWELTHGIPKYFNEHAEVKSQ